MQFDDQSWREVCPWRDPNSFKFSSLQAFKHSIFFFFFSNTYKQYSSLKNLFKRIRNILQISGCFLSKHSSCRLLNRMYLPSSGTFSWMNSMNFFMGISDFRTLLAMRMLLLFFFKLFMKSLTTFDFRFLLTFSMHELLPSSFLIWGFLYKLTGSMLSTFGVSCLTGRGS